MEHNIQTINMVKIEEFRAALAEIQSIKFEFEFLQLKTTTLQLDDVYYLSLNLFGVSEEEKSYVKKTILSNIDLQCRRYDPNNCPTEKYYLRKNLLLMHLFLTSNNYTFSWHKSKEFLLQTYVNAYGHDMVTISTITAFEVSLGIKRLQKWSDRKLRKWKSSAYKNVSLPVTMDSGLDENDLLYLVFNHPQSELFSAADKKFMINLHQYPDYIEYYNAITAQEDKDVDYKNEYFLRKLYFLLNFWSHLSKASASAFALQMHSNLCKDILYEDYGIEVEEYQDPRELCK